MIGVALAVILISLLAYLVRKAYQVNQHWAKLGVKHLKPLLFFGNSLPTILGKKSPNDVIETLCLDYPNEPILGFYEFMTPKLLIRDPDLIQAILIKDFSSFMDHGFDINIGKNPRDEQLFFMNGNRWRAFRTKLSPIFTSGKLKEMYSIMSSVGENLIEYLRVRENEEMDAVELMELFSMDVISSAVFGVDPATLKNPDCEFRKMGQKVNSQGFANLLRMFSFFAFPKLMKALGISFQSPHVTNYFQNIIQNTLNYRKENNIRRNDFIQMMTQLKEKGQVEVQTWDVNEEDAYLKTDQAISTSEKFEINDDNLMAQALGFMVAGFSGTTFIMAFTVFELTQHLDIQQKVREEILEQVNTHGGFSYDSLKNMKLLDLCIKETERKHTLAPALFRKCTKTYELPNGYVIQKGDIINIPVAAVHWDPKIYPDPKSFKPERFNQPIKPGTFLPFGEGPRICIAMRYAMLVMKYGLALLLMNYKVTLSSKTSVPLKMNPRAFGAIPLEKILLHLERLQ